MKLEMVGFVFIGFRSPLTFALMGRKLLYLGWIPGSGAHSNFGTNSDFQLLFQTLTILVAVQVKQKRL